MPVSNARSSSRAAGWVGAGRLVGTLVLAFAICVAGPPVAPPAQAQAPEGAPLSFADLVDRLLPVVVNISTTQRSDTRRPPAVPQFPEGSPFQDFFDDFVEEQDPDLQPREATALGSGFIVDPAGYVVTNLHVIEGADEIRVILHDDTNLPAEVLGTDQKTDLALLKVESPTPLPFAPWGDSDGSRVGDWIIAIGNPFGLGGSVSAGIISAQARDLDSGPYDEYIQTDAAINRGNSGGPMFNLDGEVIGVNTAIISPTGGSVGIGFAIPASIARAVVAQLQEHGRTRRGWLGVRIQHVTPEIAESLDLDRARGALIASTTADGPAAAAGIEAGDVVLSFNGRPVRESRRLPRIVADTAIGAEVPVVVWRHGQEVELMVVVGELDETAETAALAPPAQPDQAQDEAVVAELGLTLGTITDERRNEFNLGTDAEGVVVVSVEPGSPSDLKGIVPGDVIVEVMQEPVNSPGDVAMRVREAEEVGRRSVLVLLDRGGELRFEAIRIE
ncbi:MAG: DegQ family serine endoprotease [Alphaproteobacteria bacterium]